MKITKILLKIILGAILLGCLSKMPYGYYQFVRIAACLGFIYIAYIEYKAKREITALLSVGCAILFNPIVRVYFTRKIWNQIDLILAIGLIIWAIIELYLLYGKGIIKKR